MEKVLIIVGPTGIGKTKLSISLAKELKGEIISGDSMQVYKDMDIGTAKITQKEMEQIPHHLVDFLFLDEEYNVMKFQALTRTTIKQIKERNHTPILCGGTGLYIKSAIYDYTFKDQVQDESFIKFLKLRSNEELWGLLKVVDPKACEKIHPNNVQRMQRAIYMAHCGEKKSDILEEQLHQPIYDAYIIGLTMERDRLYERIDKRVDAMMQQGLLEEINNLVTANNQVWKLQSFQGIGYKEWKEYFDGTASVEECVERIKKNSRNFAKRQYTWFKNQMQVHWYDVEEKDYYESIIKDVKEWLNE